MLRTLRYVLLALIVLSGTTTVRLRASNSSSGVIAAIEKKYAVTEMTPDHEQVTKDGTTMVMKTAGVYGAPSSTMIAMPDNQIEDGKIKPPGGFMRMVLVKSGAHVLQTNDKVYVTKIENKGDAKGDVLKFTIVTVDSLDTKTYGVAGDETKKKFDATVSFRFKKGYLDETPPNEVEQAIETVFAPDSGSDDAKGEDKSNGGAPTQEARAQAPSKPAPPPAPVAAAPAAPAAPPPTISIGETSTQVLQALGMPQQMIDLGKKKTFIYKSLNMKIIFQDDKVSDVQ